MPCPSSLHGNKAAGRLLLITALNIWLTNIIVYALWYWQLDRSGPLERQSGQERGPDLLFLQMSMTPGPLGWRPGLLDDLFVSFTNAVAFSPTVTLPASGARRWPPSSGIMALRSAVRVAALLLTAWGSNVQAIGKLKERHITLNIKKSRSDCPYFQLVRSVIKTSSGSCWKGLSTNRATSCY